MYKYPKQLYARLQAYTLIFPFEDCQFLEIKFTRKSALSMLRYIKNSFLIDLVLQNQKKNVLL